MNIPVALLRFSNCSTRLRLYFSKQFSVLILLLEQTLISVVVNITILYGIGVSHA